MSCSKWLLSYLFLAVLGFCCYAWAFSSCGKVGEGGLLATCIAWIFHCGGFSCCGVQSLGMQASVVVAWGLSSCNVRTLGRKGFSHCRAWAQLLQLTGSRAWASVVVEHGLSCSAACGIFLDQESNLCPLHRQVDCKPLDHQVSPLFYVFYNDSSI